MNGNTGAQFTASAKGRARSAPTGKEYAAAASMLVFALFAAFGPDALRGEFLFLRVIEDPNNLLSFYPWNIFSARSLASGYFPLFNPFNACGVPHLANYQSAPLYPLHLLLFLYPKKLLFDLFIFVRLFLLGFGTYLLVRQLKMSHMSGVLAMLAAAFNGYFMRYHAMVHLNVEVLLPWVLWLVLVAAEKRAFRDWVFLTGLLAAGLVGGNAESAFFMALIALLWAAWLTLNKRGITALLLTMGALVAAGVLSLAQTLPFLEYLPQAWHIHPTGTGDLWLDARGIISLAAPDLFGTRVGFAPYAGALVLLLAVVGTARDRRTWFFFILALLMFALIFGPPGTKWLSRLPGLGRTASLKYAFAPLGVAMAVLAGRGLEAIISGEATSSRVRRAALAIAIFILCFVLGGWVIEQPMNPTGAFVALIALALAALVTSYFNAEGPSLKKYIPPSLAGVVWLELIINFYGLYSHSILDPGELRNTSQVEYLIQHRNEGRVAALPEALPANMNLLWSISDVALFDALYPKPYVKRMSEALDFDMNDSTQYFKTHGYYFPITPESIPSPVWREIGVRYYLGREFAGAQRAGPLQDAGINNILRDNSAWPLVELNGESLTPIIGEQWRHTLEPSRENRELIARYNYLPGWRAWFGGEEIPVLRHDGTFMKVAIPGGRGELHLRYMPWGWKVGLWALIGGLIALTGWWAVNIITVREKT